jgi:hypothetical protein
VALRAVIACVVTAALVEGCHSVTDAPPAVRARARRPQTVVLLATPKIIPDFASPDAAVAQFLDHYELLTKGAAQTVVIFAVGNSDHILRYRGMNYWSDTVEWARYTEFLIPVSDRVLDYHQVAAIVASFKSHAASVGINLKVFDQIDSGLEFAQNSFKVTLHPECLDSVWQSFDIRGRLTADDAVYASRPHGIVAGTPCGEVLADQVASYTHDLGFDGIFYGNQLGTRGRWSPGNGPGYTADEAAAIAGFMEYSKRVLGDESLVWMDSYNNVRVEHDTWSFPAAGYRSFDYLLASGFCVITSTDRYLDDLRSKLQLGDSVRVLASLDYVDPWYTYNSMTAFPEQSARLEDIAIEYRDQIDGILFFANDEVGAPVPRRLIDSFAARYWAAP